MDPIKKKNTCKITFMHIKTLFPKKNIIIIIQKQVNKQNKRL
jgi:hypothetical protein